MYRAALPSRQTNEPASVPLFLLQFSISIKAEAWGATSKHQIKKVRILARYLVNTHSNQIAAMTEISSCRNSFRDYICCTATHEPFIQKSCTFFDSYVNHLHCSSFETSWSARQTIKKDSAKSGRRKRRAVSKYNKRTD